MNPTLAAFQAGCNELHGQSCWSVSWSRPFNLVLEFGPPRLYTSTWRLHPGVVGRRPKVSVIGTWRLHVLFGYWRMTVENGPVRMCSQTSGTRQMQSVFRMLEGESLARIRIDSRTGRTDFGFSLGGRLEVRRPLGSPNESMWWVSRRDGEDPASVWEAGLQTNGHAKAKRDGRTLPRVPLSPFSVGAVECMASDLSIPNPSVRGR